MIKILRDNENCIYNRNNRNGSILFMSNFLIKNGYEIHGLIQATSSIEHLDKHPTFFI